MKYRKKRFSLFFLSKSLATEKTRKDIGKMLACIARAFYAILWVMVTPNTLESEILESTALFYVRISTMLTEGTME